MPTPAFGCFLSPRLLGVVGLLAASLTFSAQAQSSALAIGESAGSATAPASDAIVANAFSQPTYPGGSAAMMAFLNKNLRYPAASQEKGTQGRVMVTFWVDEQGHAYGFGTLQAPDEALAAEAIRVTKLMPAWNPGRQDGRIQPMMVYVPVSFKLAKQ